MNRVVVVLATICCVAIPCLSLCPDGWTRFAKKCYFKSQDLATRDDNLRLCHAMGGDLVTIRNKEENNFLRNFLKSDKSNNFFWLSAIRIKIGSKEFKWRDGTEMTFSDWNVGQPNLVHRLRQVCLDINPENGWNDILCHERLQQLCEKEVVVDCSRIEKIDEKDKDILQKECPQLFFGAQLRMKENEIQALQGSLTKLTLQFDELRKTLALKQTNEEEVFRNQIEALNDEVEKLKKPNDEDQKCCKAVDQKTTELTGKLNEVDKTISIQVQTAYSQCEKNYQELNKKIEGADKRLADLDKIMEKKLFQWAKNIGR